MEKKLGVATCSLVFLIPALILVVPGAGEVSFGILAILGIAKTVKDRSNLFIHPGNRLLAMICWTFFSVSLLSVLASDPSVEGFRRLGTNIHFLLAPFIGILFSSTPDVLKRFVHGNKMGAILVGIVAFIEHSFLAQVQANGAVNEIVFGDLAVLLGFLSIVSFFKESDKEKVVSGLAFCLAILAAVLSGSRGAWVAAIILPFVVLFIWWMEGSLDLRRLMVSLLVFGIVAAAAISTPVFQNRIKQMTQELKNLEDYSVNTSVRQRIVKWKAALKVWGNAPVLGHGIHKANIAVGAHVESPLYRNQIVRQSHLENEYLTSLVGKGLLGLISVLLLLFGPIVALRKHLQTSSGYTYAAMGILVCTGYAVFGLTNLAFGHGIMNTFYVFMLSMTLNQMVFISANNTSTQENNEQFPDPNDPKKS